MAEAWNLQDIALSMFNIQIDGAGTDGWLELTPPAEIEHVDGQLGDAAHYRTGMRTTTGTLSILQTAAVNEDLHAVINEARTSSTNGQGAFHCRIPSTGQVIQGDVTLDGYPPMSVQAGVQNYVYSFRVYNFESKYE